MLNHINQTMNYEETVKWIFEKLPMYQRVGAPAYKADLENTHKLMNLTGNPHHDLKCIHVAGTNGKGSVAHMLASILQETGFKVGLYTSPHLFDYRERMRVNGQMIPENFVTEFIGKYKDKIETIEPSFFEISVAMALCWFKSEKVNIAIIETGMGGRLDSTNVITPVLSVITNISMDHTMFLGETIKEIAIEKAGIIKPGVPVVIGESQKGTLSVFKKAAAAKESILKQADKKLYFLHNMAISDCLCGNILREGELYIKNISCPLQGEYQKMNILTVVESVRILREAGMPIRKRHIRKGIKNVIKNTGLMGRWEFVSKSPRIICDVGHNMAGLKLIFQQLGTMKYGKLHIVLGVNNDKNLDELFEILPQNARYYFCKASVPRAMDANELAIIAHPRGYEYATYLSVLAAFEHALQQADHESDIIFVGGSTFVVAEIPLLKNKLTNDVSG